jgi:hypothetical protein
MARVRYIKPGFFTNEALADCQPLTRLLFAGLWTIADREGRLEDRPRKIKIEILPYDDCNVDSLLSELVTAGFITRYEVNGAKFIQIGNFVRHQQPHHKELESRIPPPESVKEEVTPNQQDSDNEPSLNQDQIKIEPSLNQDQIKIESSFPPETVTETVTETTTATGRARAREPAVVDDDFLAKKNQRQNGNGKTALSKFLEEVCREYVDSVLVPRGGVTNPGGLAHTIYENGKSDREIQTWLNSGKKPEQARRKGMAVQP